MPSLLLAAARHAAFALVVTSVLPASAQSLYTANPTSPLRYAAAHGERALLGGNAAAGLEAWVYPLQILRGLKPSFAQAGSVAAVPGEQILRSIEYTPTSIVRTFVAEKFTIRETLFVPRATAGALLSYEIDSRQPVAVELSFVPVMDLMWPVGVGGQEFQWKADENAYEMHEPTNRFHAIFGSPDVLQHDDLINTNMPLASEHTVRVLLRAGRSARFVIAGSTASAEEARAVYAKLRDAAPALEAEAVRKQQEWAAGTLHIETPDAEVNKALSWSQWALEQAWVCNPALGCGLVAGYGPSRGLARRPQYDWFFAGDALTTLPALLLSGQFDRTRQALEFLLKYQDQRTGMMWHEMSQSAGYVHWSDYPYMFPHVDITFQLLPQVEAYVRSTGDVAFLRAHWDAFAKAYQYCSSIIDPSDGLPRVPHGKEGSDEQRHPREELSLAVAWMEASSSYADLATQAGHPQLAQAARKASERAAAAIPSHFWNPATNFFASGILSDGTPEPEMHLPPRAALALLDEARRKAVLDRISGPEFQTAWGTRGVGSASPTFDPASYATGSVWAKSTAGTAAELWSEGRPEEAFRLWENLLPWFSLDSMGHLHETLTGSAFRPQTESVPEQTWSSAQFVSSFLTGAAGLKLDAENHTLRFAPVLPSKWDHLGLEHLKVGQDVVSLQLHRGAEGETVEFSGTGRAPLTLTFTPQRGGAVACEIDGRELSLPAAGQPIVVAVNLDGAMHRLVVKFPSAP